MLVRLSVAPPTQLTQKRLRKLQEKLEKTYELSALFSQTGRTAIRVLKDREQQDEVAKEFCARLRE